MDSNSDNQFSLRHAGTAQNLMFNAKSGLVPELVQFSKRLKNIPQEFSKPPHALVVGGFVRNALLRVPTKDADVLVLGVSPDRLESFLEKEYGSAVESVGKSFGVYKIRFAHLENAEIDVVLPRKDSKVSAGHRGFQISYDPEMTYSEEATRRDFTINTIGFDYITGELYDPFNALEDVQYRILRIVNQDTFSEDPLRVYRALQMTARFNLNIEDETFRTLEQMVQGGILSELPKERIRVEFEKMVTLSLRPSEGLELARRLGVIQKYYPELDALITTEQEPEWHPEGSVWNHTLMALDQAAVITLRPDNNFSSKEKLTVLLSVLCHDLGKPTTSSIGEDGKIHSRGHAPAGAPIAQRLLKRLGFSADICRTVSKCVSEHMNPPALYSSYVKKDLNEEKYAAALRRLLRRLDAHHYPKVWKIFIACCEADFRGRGLPQSQGGAYPIGELFKSVVEKYKLDSLEGMQTLITGKDVTAVAEKLGLVVSPGPLYRTLIQEVEDLRESGSVQTKTEALLELEKLLEKYRNENFTS